MKIVSCVVNNPEFIEAQYTSLCKYMNGPFEYIVFNDAKDFPDITNEGDIQLRYKISQKCKELGVVCIIMKNNHHKNISNASDRHADTLNSMLQFQLANPDRYLLIDSDMILIDYYDISKYFKYKAAIILKTKGKYMYMWPGLCYLDFTTITDGHLLDWRCVNGILDTGGKTTKWLHAQTMPSSTTNGKPQPTIYLMQQQISGTWNITNLPKTIPEYTNIAHFLQTDKRNVDNTFFCELFDGCFLHYRGGSNWMGTGLSNHSIAASRLTDIIRNTAI